MASLLCASTPVAFNKKVYSTFWYVSPSSLIITLGYYLNPSVCQGKKADYRDVFPCGIARAGNSLRTIGWRDGGSVQVKCRLKVLFMYSVIYIYLLVIYHFQNREVAKTIYEKFWNYHVLSNLVVVLYWSSQCLSTKGLALSWPSKTT